MASHNSFDCLSTIEGIENIEAKKLQRTNCQQIALEVRRRSQLNIVPEPRFKHEPAPFPTRAGVNEPLLTLRNLLEQLAENDKQAVRKRQLIQEHLTQLNQLESEAEKLAREKQAMYGDEFSNRPDFNKIHDRFRAAVDAVREHYAGSTAHTNAAEAAWTEYQVSVDELCRRIDREREKTAADFAAVASQRIKQLEEDAAAAEVQRKQVAVEAAVAEQRKSLSDLDVRRKLYEHCVKHVNVTQSLVVDISTNPLNRSCKNAYYLFINTVVNTMSSRALSEVRNSVQKVLRFFAGGLVPTVGGKTIDLSLHRYARTFCMQKLCQRVLKQISSKGEVQQSAASIMSLAIFSAELWSELPEFGTMLMAHMLVDLPILIPYRPPQSSVKHETVLAGLVLGYAKFFAAVASVTAQRRPSSGFFASQLPNVTQTLSAGAVFMLILRLIKDEANSAMALKVLYALLTFGGESLLQIYGDKQFSKLTTLICDDFVMGLEQAASTEERADVKPDCLRLQLFKQHLQTTKQVVPIEDGLTRDYFAC